MILDEYVEVTMVGKNCKYYGDKGYPNQYGSKIMVKIEDLATGAHVKVIAKCDICGAIHPIKYQDYLKNTQNNTRLYTCSKCKNIKYRETCKEKYGVEFATQSPKVKEKTKQTSLDKYGYTHFLQDPEIQKKRQTTIQERYGVSYMINTPEVKQRRKERCIELFGTENPFNSELCQEQIHLNNIKKFGGKSPMASQDIRNKVIQTMYCHSSQKCSAQQKYLHNLYGGILNYPCSSYALDVYLPEYNLDIEYNGGGHDLSVQMHDISQQDFNIKEIIRGKTIRSMGINQMTIISSKDFLPKDTVLLSMLNQAVSFFNETEHHWITFDLDTSCFKNITGTYPYDFGELISKRTLYTLMSINEENNIEEAS